MKEGEVYKTGKRIVFETKRYTWRQRIRIYLAELRAAVATLPPETYEEMVRVGPLDRRFADAMWEDTYIVGPSFQLRVSK